MSKIAIIGGGLAGLVAAHMIKEATVYEGANKIEGHKALLRFRDKSVSDATGVPFKQVRVHKEISFAENAIHQPTIALANMYSKKVTGCIAGRSIWNLAPCDRYVAPEDFYSRLVENLETQRRIEFNHGICGAALASLHLAKVPIVSTMPLPAMMELVSMHKAAHQFKRSAIKVDRYRVPNADVYQTIYFPDPDFEVFRASITGDLLIVESVKNENGLNWEGVEMGYVLRAFGIEQVDFIDSVDQKYGKIIDLPKEDREAILYALTREFGVFSVGRFATWRNILLDDVVKDVRIVESLIKASAYDRSRIIGSK